MSKASKTGDKGRQAGTKPCPWLTPITTLLPLLLVAVAATNPAPSPPEPSPVTARDFFNAGTHQLRDGRLPEAESQLQEALAKQEVWLQPAALYNLGEVRFGLGERELKKAPDAKKAAERTRTAAGRGAAAIESADAAILRGNPQGLVEAYRLGKGTRKELSVILKAIETAMAAHASVLLKWQRAAGDFKGAAELNPADTNAPHNAEIVSRHIARLIDEMQELQQARSEAGEKKEQLGQKLSQLRGLLPNLNEPQGSDGDDEEEENTPNSPQPGMQEGPAKPGQEMKMSPEDSGDVLNGYRLDDGRRLPMGGDEGSKPPDPKRRTW
jgi:hypothetical protein